MQKHPPPSITGSILVVDDNNVNRIMLSRYLGRLNYEATLVENGRQALEKLQDEIFDLILLDVQMPEMDGYQVLEHLKADPRWREIPVIIISASGDVEHIKKGLSLEADHYLAKPCKIEDILKALRLMVALIPQRNG